MQGMKRLFLFLSGALCLAGVSTFAANGVVISMKRTAGTSTATTQIQLDPNHMRTQMAGRGGAENTVIFDGNRQAMMMIDDAKKTYTEITKEDLDRMAAQLQGMMANVQPE